jgi:hypothetical protein
VLKSETSLELLPAEANTNGNQNFLGGRLNIMKTRVLLLITLALAVPLAAMADTETFASTGGSL